MNLKLLKFEAHQNKQSIKSGNQLSIYKVLSISRYAISIFVQTREKMNSDEQFKNILLYCMSFKLICWLHIFFQCLLSWQIMSYNFSTSSHANYFMWLIGVIRLSSGAVAVPVLPSRRDLTAELSQPGVANNGPSTGMLGLTLRKVVDVSLKT